MCGEDVEAGVVYCGNWDVLPFLLHGARERNARATRRNIINGDFLCRSRGANAEVLPPRDRGREVEVFQANTPEALDRGHALPG